MSYDKLSKVFYKKGNPFYEQEIEKRKSSYGSYLTELEINGFRKGKVVNDTYSLFYVNTHVLMNLNNQVLLNSSKISSLINKLPRFVIEPYFLKLIVNEAQSNNEIEGIRSTRKELKDVLQDVMKSKKNSKRFKGMMKTYLFIDEIQSFNDVADFRNLYDELVSDEVDKDGKPDGEMFRKDYVEINDGTKTTHIGVNSEAKIIESLDALIHFLEDENHPELYRYMVAHYYYEYIHPFYDGNGRTGRLLVCSYLSRYLERYSAITFSYAVNNNKSKYYKALEEVPNPFNQGETTFYLIDMLELLLEGQQSIIEELEMNLAKTRQIKAFFKERRWENQQEAKNVLRVMLHLNVFVSDSEPLSMPQLMELTNQSRYKTNQVMAYLEKEAFVEIVSQRPKKYRVADEFLENILL